uniref:Enolase 4 n=1 Tax=Phallusia mammillata TaxID=59560 RepID=A0A6F9DCR4_9ASCI|nr:enolase-like protein ENO4 [Phallusia mammillata]
MASETNDLKQQAADFYAENKVPERLEEILNSMFFENPKDVYGRLAEYFSGFAVSPVFAHSNGSEVLDSAGNPAVLCQVYGTVKNHDKLLSEVSMSLDKEMTNILGQMEGSGDSIPTISEVATANVSKLTEDLTSKLSGIPLINQLLIDRTISDWVNDVERSLSKETETKSNEGSPNRTPTPSSGKKKKASAKTKTGKPSDKPVPPKEPLENRMMGCTSASVSSLAVAKAAANCQDKPLFEHLHHSLTMSDSSEKGVYDITMPTPAMIVYTGGKTAPGKLNLIKNLFIIGKPNWSSQESCEKLNKVHKSLGKILSAKASSGVPTGTSGGFQPTYDKMEQPLDVVLEAINASGLTPTQDVFIGLTISAHEIFDYDKGKYEIATGTLKSADEICDVYRDALSRYPAVIMIIDPLRKEDREQWPKLCEAVSEKCFVLGSDHVMGPLHSLTANMLDARNSSGVVISNGGRVTCSDLARITGDLQARHRVAVLRSPPGDAAEESYTDLGVGLGADVVVFGAPCRGENTARINRLVEIERLIKNNDKFRLQQRSKFTFPVIKPPPAAPGSDDEPDVIQSSPDFKAKKK